MFHFTIDQSLIEDADANGTVSWYRIVRFVSAHDEHFRSEFNGDYSGLVGERIDVGEFLTWAGY